MVGSIVVVEQCSQPSSKKKKMTADEGGR